MGNASEQANDAEVKALDSVVIKGIDLIRDELPEYARGTYAGRIQEQFRFLYRSIPSEVLEKTDRRILEIGSGFGGAILALGSSAGLAVGVEPEEWRLDLTKKLFARAGSGEPVVCRAIGESLPFADKAFDIVMSYFVLEHASDAQCVLREASRVLRCGGYLHFIVPNYGSVIEGHYNIPWIPYLPRLLATAYVRLFRIVGLTRLNHEYLRSLNLITPRWLERVFCEKLPSMRVTDWGIEVWAERMRAGILPNWATDNELGRMVMRGMAVCRTLGLLEVMSKVGGLLRFHYPIALTACRVR